MSEATRGWIYRIVLAVLALAAAYGIIDGDQVPLWLALAVAVLGIGTNTLATLNTTVKKPPTDGGPGGDEGYMTMGQCLYFVLMLVAIYAVIFVCLLAFK